MLDFFSACTGKKARLHQVLTSVEIRNPTDWYLYCTVRGLSAPKCSKSRFAIYFIWTFKLMLGGRGSMCLDRHGASAEKSTKIHRISFLKLIEDTGFWNLIDGVATFCWVSLCRKSVYIFSALAPGKKPAFPKYQQEQTDTELSEVWALQNLASLDLQSTWFGFKNCL